LAVKGEGPERLPVNGRLHGLRIVQRSEYLVPALTGGRRPRWPSGPRGSALQLTRVRRIRLALPARMAVRFCLLVSVSTK
jgi:hypothetical protein